MRERKDPLFEAIYECWFGRSWGSSVSMTATQRGRINRAVKELRAIGATPDQVRTRWGQLTSAWPTLTLTPQTICAHWNTSTGTATTSAADRWLERTRT